MSCCIVKNVELIDNIYRFHLECDDTKVSLGYIDMNINEIDSTKINDPLTQKTLMRNYIQRRCGY